MKIIEELLAEATEECITCKGTGWRPLDKGGRVWCVDCKGSGRMLSDDGRALVAFAAQWLRPHFAEADHGHSLH